MFLNSAFLVFSTFRFGIYDSIGLCNVIFWAVSLASEPCQWCQHSEVPPEISNGSHAPVPQAVSMRLSLPRNIIDFQLRPRNFTFRARTTTTTARPEFADSSETEYDEEASVGHRKSDQSTELTQLTPRPCKGGVNSSSTTRKPPETRKKKRKKSKPPILDRFEMGCTKFEQVIIDGPYGSLDIAEHELCISVSKIPTCHFRCREQRNTKKKYRFACLNKSEESTTAASASAVYRINGTSVNYMEHIIYQVNQGVFVDMSKKPTRRLKKKFPSGCVSVV